MSIFLRFLPALFTLLVLPSCTVVPSGVGIVYQAAVDERNIKTIVQDTDIYTRVYGKILDDETLSVLDLTVSCYRGVVYLVGEYKNKAQKKRIIEIAQKAEGVKDLKIFLVPEIKKKNCFVGQSLITTGMVTAAFIGDEKTWSTNIDVRTIKCSTVVLWGVVGSKKEINRAIKIAKNIKGVQKVVSLLIVR